MQVGRSRLSWKFLKVREWRGEAESSETPLFDRGLIQRSISKHERLANLKRRPATVAVADLASPETKFRETSRSRRNSS